MSELAVNGCTFKISSTAGTIEAVSLVATSQPSQDITINNKGVYFDKVTVVITTATIVPTIPVEGTTNTGVLASDSEDINGTAGNILELPAGSKAVQKGDKVTVTKNFTFTTTSSPPSTTEVAMPFTVEVSDAGQTGIIAT